MTCLLVAYHSTNRKNRDTIVEFSLLPAQPQRGRPFGVYVFREDFSFNHASWNSSCWWSVAERADLWRVAYFGRACMDQYVINGMVLLDRVTSVTLVTGHNAD